MSIHSCADLSSYRARTLYCGNAIGFNTEPLPSTQINTPRLTRINPHANYLINLAKFLLNLLHQPPTQPEHIPELPESHNPALTTCGVIATAMIRTRTTTMKYQRRKGPQPRVRSRRVRQQRLRSNLTAPLTQPTCPTRQYTAQTRLNTAMTPSTRTMGPGETSRRTETDTSAKDSHTGQRRDTQTWEAQMREQRTGHVSMPHNPHPLTPQHPRPLNSQPPHALPRPHRINKVT